MATDHYLNKVFVYIPREDNNSPPTISCPFTKSSTRGRE
jgi:hypothetical protein